MEDYSNKIYRDKDGNCTVPRFESMFESCELCKYGSRNAGVHFCNNFDFKSQKCKLDSSDIEDGAK